MYQLKRHSPTKSSTFLEVYSKGTMYGGKWPGPGPKGPGFKLKVCLQGLEEAIHLLWALVFICKMSTITPFSWAYCEDQR